MKPEYLEKYECVSREKMSEILQQENTCLNFTSKEIALSKNRYYQEETCLALENQLRISESSSPLKARRRLSFTLCSSVAEKHPMKSLVVNVTNTSQNKTKATLTNIDDTSFKAGETFQDGVRVPNGINQKSNKVFETTLSFLKEQKPKANNSFSAKGDTKVSLLTKKKASSLKEHLSCPLLKSIPEKAKLQDENDLSMKKTMKNSSHSFLPRRSSIIQKVRNSYSLRRSSNKECGFMMQASSMPCLKTTDEELPNVKVKSKAQKSNIYNNIRSLFKTRPQEQEQNKTTQRKEKAIQIQKGLSLTNVLHNEEGVRTMFEEFLKKEFSDENLNFWLEVEEYKKLNIFEEAAEKIFNTYIANFAKREINIESHTRKEIQLKLSNPDTSMFDEAQSHIFNLMENDSFRRFLCHCN